jgi:hypothetical protein
VKDNKYILNLEVNIMKDYDFKLKVAGAMLAIIVLAALL